MSLALVVRLDISEVARVSILAVWQTMLVAFRVKVASRAHAVWGGAISILMDVEGVLLAGRQSFTDSPSCVNRTTPWQCCLAVGCKTATAWVTGVVSAEWRVNTAQITDAASIVGLFITLILA